MAPKIRYGTTFEINEIRQVAGGVIAYGTGESGRMGRIKKAGIFFLLRLSMNYHGVVNDGMVLHAVIGEPYQGKYPTLKELLEKSRIKTVQEILDKNLAHEAYRAKEPERREILKKAFPGVSYGYRVTDAKGNGFIVETLMINTKGEVVPALKLTPMGYGFEKLVWGEEAQAFLRECGVG